MKVSGRDGLLLVSGAAAGLVVGIAITLVSTVSDAGRDPRSLDVRLTEELATLRSEIGHLGRLLDRTRSDRSASVDAQPERVVAAPTPGADTAPPGAATSSIDARLASLEAEILHLVDLLTKDPAQLPIPVAKQTALVESLAARLETGEEERQRVRTEHFRWSKRQVQELYGTPDRADEDAWYYDLSTAREGRHRVLTLVFREGYLTDIWVWEPR
ncbi:MAG: hypothetical protein AB1486_04920 [Planctomycetota bacterium]